MKSLQGFEYTDDAGAKGGATSLAHRGNDRGTGWTGRVVLGEVTLTNYPNHSNFDASLHGLALS